MDHGRALGLLPGGGWQGWQALLDLSPKIPPLASLLNGTVIALAGDSPDQASWALAIWQGLLLVVVACWGRQLVSPGFGLLAAALTSTTPALVALRVDFTLDLPLAATSALALWLLGRWAAPDPRGGSWGQAGAAALALAAAVLVKQSALLVVLLPALWAAAMGLGRPQRRLQVLAALGLVLALILPWLQHNWITTIGGTNRAVLESAAQEGDPPAFSLASLLWYLRLWPEQLGLMNGLPGLVGGLAAATSSWRKHLQPSAPETGQGWDWSWLIGCAFSGWLFTTLSPNKDPRYIAPVLPLLVLLLARGWWVLLLWFRARWGRKAALAMLGLGLIGGATTTAAERAEALERKPPFPMAELIRVLRQRVGTAPTTVIVIPTTGDFNQSNVTVFGRSGGGEIVGREIGKRAQDHPLVLREAEWLVLATGDQGTHREVSRQLSRQVRSDGRFERLSRWSWNEGRSIELWRRRADAPAPTRFDQRFIGLARGMEQGPRGLAAVFASIGPEHQLDGHFRYQERVARWANEKLRINPDDRDALWSLALLGVLQNRPMVASQWFSRLETLEPANPWPAAYHSVVLLADWRAPQAAAVAQAAQNRHDEPVLKGLADLAVSLSGNLTRIPALRSSLPAAVDAVQGQLSNPPAPSQ
ncbi:glycosyltransferase family 39 protein [Cyanobium sp. ATX 6F1]|uniref:glycosyltransferase family 39 protein n=1 Tax=Cyanobium sp. ATX 6F1 TaxID=2823702 RepID=UPI0020CB872C|nr:glycosyltransferase family 39 protein [Cyanobium sp. ATX 6F1]